jgi:2,4-dienoyl-CoA reductase-like NADH-dependent reductase (Old Yellow Enzyme family)
VDAGFRHLQVHAAHGYLFNLLVDDRLNENASEVRERLANWALRHTAAGIETSLRISLRSGDVKFYANGRELFHEQIAGLPFDFIDVSSGFHNIDKQLIYPGRPDVLRARRAETIALANRFPERRFILSGRALAESQQDLPPNLHIGIRLRQMPLLFSWKGPRYLPTKGKGHLSVQLAGGARSPPPRS